MIFPALKNSKIYFCLISVLKEDYAVRVRPALSSAASRTSEAVVEVTPGNSIVLRCEVSTPALASHLIVDSWTTFKDAQQRQIHSKGQSLNRRKINGENLQSPCLLLLCLLLVRQWLRSRNSCGFHSGKLF